MFLQNCNIKMNFVPGLKKKKRVRRIQGGKLGAFLKFENGSVRLPFQMIGGEREGMGHKGRDRQS